MKHVEPVALEAPSLLRQFLAWVAAQPRSYGATMDAWRTSCPRLSIWEDATADGLVAVLPCDGPQAECPVVLTELGQAMLGKAHAR